MLPRAETIVAAVAVVMLLQSLGGFALFRWAMVKVAEEAAERAEEKALAKLALHLADEFAHPAAMARHHASLERRLDAIEGGVHRLELAVSALVAEHRAMVDKGLCPTLPFRREKLGEG